MAYFVSFSVDLAVCIASPPPPEGEQGETSAQIPHTDKAARPPAIRLLSTSIGNALAGNTVDKATQEADGTPADESDAEFLARMEVEDAAGFAA